MMASREFLIRLEPHPAAAFRKNYRSIINLPCRNAHFEPRAIAVKIGSHGCGGWVAVCALGVVTDGFSSSPFFQVSGACVCVDKALSF